MLVTFYCDAFENITYLGDVAARLLEYMQHGTNIPGAIVAEEVPDALGYLRKAVSQEMQNPNADELEISIDKRALPLINLLEAACKAKCDVMWRH